MAKFTGKHDPVALAGRLRAALARKGASAMQINVAALPPKGKR
jgi:hypothetical protein